MSANEFDGMPFEEAERILHARGVALNVRLYQKLGHLSHLAMLLYGGEKVFGKFAQSLGDDFLDACLRQPKSERRAPEDAITYMLHINHTDMQNAAVLLSKLEAERLATTATLLDVSIIEIETAIISAIAVLLNAKQLMLVQTLSFVLHFGSQVIQQMDTQG